jgi:hypothetical protein
MNNICLKTTRSLVLASTCLLLWVPAFSQEIQTDPQVRYDVKHDVSAPVRELVRNEPPIRGNGGPMLEPQRNLGLTVGLPGEDTVVQDEILPPVQTSKVLSLDGMTGSQAGGYYPPDTNGAVGSTQFVEITNVAFSVYDKTSGKKLVGPNLIHTIWKGFGGECEQDDGGDPVVLWDNLSQRWMVSQLQYSGATWVCIAVSTTMDATGSYNRYAYTFGNVLPDYPKYSVWPDAYYLSVNAFGNGSAEPCAFDRKAMAAGKTAAQICFTPNNNNFSFLPSDIDGSTAPPSGAPAHFVELGNSTNQLTYWDFHVDFTHPKKSTFTGPNNITVPSFSLACGGGTCIPQPSPGESLDSLGDRLMFRLPYRNFGDHESLLVTHSVAPGKSSKASAAVRWYELRATPPGSAFSLYQSGTFQNKATSLWMGSVGMDKQGDIALGMSASSTALDPSVWYTGRVPGDPLGKMETAKVVVKGSAVQKNGAQRWGDYSSMSIDPSDDCTFWYTQEYYNKKNGGSASNDWSTHFVAFKFNVCK